MSDATVLLGKGLDQDRNIIEVRGTLFYRTGSTGFADGMEAVQNAGLIQIPIYLLGEGRVAAGRVAKAQGDIQLALQESVWRGVHDGLAEVDTVVDTRSILGEKGKLYVARFQNGGLFVQDHQRIKDAVLGQNGRQLTANYAMPLSQKEVNIFLDAVKARDANALRQMEVLQGGSLYVFKNFGEFADESSKADFLADMPGYVVVRAADDARAQGTGYKEISVQRGNQDLAIDFGGVAQAGAVLNLAEKLGMTTFGSFTSDHGSYSSRKSGRGISLNNGSGGVGTTYSFSTGHSVGVTPEALQARAKIVAPLPLEVAVAKESITPDLRTAPEDHV